MRISVSEFADKMGEIMPVIIQEFARHQLKDLYKDNVTFPQCLVLTFLDVHGELKMKDLARYMGVTTAAMTGIVDRLVRYGYVERVFDPRDRRIIKIKPTTKGFSLVKRIKQQKRQMIINIFGKISQNDREEYLRIVTKIRDILTEQKSDTK